MKIVAIGGGNNSNFRKPGVPEVYEQEDIDLEIIKLSGKSNPNVLYISHASPKCLEHAMYKKIQNTYEMMYNCPTKLLTVKRLNNEEVTNEFMDWADVIYVGGGNTKAMLDLWKETGFDKKLKVALDNNKVLCGISAGGGCWFKYTCSDYLQMESGDLSAPYTAVEGLGFIDLIFNPHAGSHERNNGIEKVSKEVNMHGLSLTNNMAIKIVDDKYQLIKGISSEGLDITATLSYWDNGGYSVIEIPNKGIINDLVNYSKYNIKN